MPRITLCMIVRNEEELLPGCLASVKRAVDEIVVVDTGSTDATKRIAKEAGARVFDFKWEDDFAAARNEALRHAHGHWVLVLDADERLAPGAAARLRGAVARATFDCGMLRLHNALKIDAHPEEVMSGRARDGEVQLVPRLLRRTGDMAYVNPIHESVMPWLRRRGTKLQGVEVDIIHFGAIPSVVESKSKIERNIKLLRARIEKDPSDLAAYGYLAHDYMRGSGLADAFVTMEQGWEHVKKVQGPAEVHRLATARAYLLIGKHRFTEARETTTLARKLEGENPDFTFLSAYAFESEAAEEADPARRVALLSEARAGYQQCLNFGPRVFAQAFVVGARGWYGLTRLGTVELHLGNPAEALRWFDKAHAERPAERAPRLGIAEALIDQGQFAEALKRLEPLLDESPDGWMLAAFAAEKMGRLDDARLLIRRTRGLIAKGFVGPHRRERLRGLLTRLSNLQGGVSADTQGHARP